VMIQMFTTTRDITRSQTQRCGKWMTFKRYVLTLQGEQALLLTA
jgi:hypothetical protein